MLWQSAGTSTQHTRFAAAYKPPVSNHVQQTSLQATCVTHMCTSCRDIMTTSLVDIIVTISVWTMSNNGILPPSCQYASQTASQSATAGELTLSA